MVTAVGAAPAVAADGDGAACGHVLGLDIGGTKLAAGVVDATGRVAVVRRRADATRRAGPERGLERLFELGRRAVADAGVDVGRDRGRRDRLRRPARLRRAAS